MKANAPEKIYIQPNIGGRELIKTWFPVKIDQESIDYVRTDAFIEKACDAYCKICKAPNCKRNECKWISDFKGHLETI